MDRKLKNRIESIAWDCTVGAGKDPDEVDAPTQEDVAYLEIELGREPTPEEMKFFNASWQDGMRSAAQR